MTTAAALTIVPRCFGPPRAAVAVAPVRLNAAHAQALAELLPLLGCGEEAAAIAFAGLAARDADPAAAAALRRVAAEEAVHDSLIAGLAAAVPAPHDAPAWLRAARRFHLALGRGSVADHLGRIAATDAAVCTVLARLLARDRPLGADQVTRGVLGRIHRDEASHVRLSRGLAVARAAPGALADGAAAARRALADVLALGGDAFETLGVDPDALFADLRTLPPGLFAT